MNKLVEEIVKPFLDEIAPRRIKKVIGIYGGRFQPFGPHHYKTYKWLQKHCDEAYITTSNIKKPPRHPMNFKEKVRHMVKMGVKKNRIVEEKTPYVANNVLKKYPKETTAVIYIFGEKDAGRLAGGKKSDGSLTYYQEYKKFKGNLKPYEEHGYVLTAPHVSISVGGKEVSGTSMRELLGSDKFDDREREKLFKKMFGYFDQGVYNMMTNKFKKLFEVEFVFKPVKIMKKLKKKWHDGKGKELLKDSSLSKKLKKVLAKLKVPNDVLSNNTKLLAFIQKNPFVVQQVLRMIAEEKINESKKEFVIWGIAPGKSSEEILYTKAKSNSEAKKIIKILVSKHGVKKARIQVLDLEQDPSKFWKSDKIFENAFDDSEVKWLQPALGSGKDLMARMYKQNTDELEKLRDKVLKSSWEQRNFYLRAIERELQRRAMVDDAKPSVDESVDLPIEIGDTVKMGKFKNKKVVVKSIDWNEKGDLLINGRPALKFRIEKKPNIFDEDTIGGGYPDKEGMKKIKKRVNKARSKSDSNKQYQYDLAMEEFLSTFDMKEVIKEVSSVMNAPDVDEFNAANTGQQLVDSGPSMFVGGETEYKKRMKKTAHDLGWEVVNYILDVSVDKVPPFKKELNKDTPPVSHLPAGIGTGTTPNNPHNMEGEAGYNAWVKTMSGIAQNVGYKLLDFMDDTEKETKKQIAKDSKETIDKQEEEEVNESFSKSWWKQILVEKVDSQDLMNVAKQLCQEYGVKPGLQLKSKVGRGDYAHYDFDRNIILISKKALRNLNEFLISILHEIDHARDYKKKGKKFIDDYEYHSNMIAQGHVKGKKDPYWDNPYEIKAEKFGRKEAKKYKIKDLFGEAKCGVGQNPETTGCTPSSKSKSKFKPKIPKFEPKIPKFSFDPDKIAKGIEAGRKEKERKDKLYKDKDRKPNIVDGVDVIKDEKDLEHFMYDMSYKGDKVEDIEKYDGEMRVQYSNQMDKLTPKERKEVRKDVLSWKQYGGYEAIQNAIDSGDTTEEEIRERNERISDISHKTVTKVKQPIERGIEIPNEDYDKFMSRFNIGEMVDIPDEGGHGSSGFSTSSKTARGFSKFEDTDSKNSSIVMKIEPNSKGEVRGLFIDGEKDEKDEFWGEGEITRSSKSKSKVSKIEKVKYPSGKVVTIITMVEPDDLSEVIVKEEKSENDIISQKYLEGPLNKEPKKQKKLKEHLVKKTQLKPRGKELLLMGGAYGHMAHPFDDKDLTFGDLKKIITDGLGGHLNREDGVTEKLDGQNIMVSWKDGELIAARNKGHIKNGGATALTKRGIASKFEGRGNIANAFNFAMNDLEKSIGKLSEKQRTKIFNNGYNFMNLEVMWPASANVIDYDVAHLVFHGALIYDDAGNVKGEVKGSARMLAGMIKQVNMHIGKKYAISKPVFLDIPKHQDFGKMKNKFVGRLNKLRKEFDLKDSDTLGMYHQSFWEEYIYNAAYQFDYKIDDDILKNLTRRWAFFDKSYKIPTIRLDLKDEPEFLDWVLKTDKDDHKKMVKENMKPFEVLFFEVGAEILKNVQGFMAANPKKSVQRMRKKVGAAISDVRKGGDLKKLNTLKLQLDKLNKIGGMNAIVPSEGIVFKYKGNTYKFTGAFAPVNQITGLISF